MSYAPSNFRRNDVKRAVQAMQAAGLKVARVELHGGKVLIIPANVTLANTSDAGDGAITAKNDWDSIYDQN